MKLQAIYDSNGQKAKTIAETFSCDVQAVKDNPKIWADVILFICPTYGDEELPHDMEDFLLNLNAAIKKNFVVCEIGNYYGYDDFEFGAKNIIQKYLSSLGWKKFFNGLSLDVIPEIRWKVLNSWKDKLYEKLHTSSS